MSKTVGLAARDLIRELRAVTPLHQMMMAEVVRDQDQGISMREDCPDCQRIYVALDELDAALINVSLKP